MFIDFNISFELLFINVKAVFGEGGGGGGTGRQCMVWGFDIFPKFVIKFPFYRQIIPVKCTKIS